VLTFRRNVVETCKQIVDKREAEGDVSRAVYMHPPDVHLDANPPDHIREILAKIDNKIYIKVYVSHGDSSRQSTTIKAGFNARPSDVVESVIQNFAKKRTNLNIDKNSILKVCGMQVFIIFFY